LKVVADRDFTVHRRGGHSEITHLSCAHCTTFAVYKSEPGMKLHSADRGFYNRMRAKMVKHLHSEHREQLAAGACVAQNALPARG
jgi:hypothetical protein